MTLLQTVQAIEAAALLQPSVAMVVPNDVFRLNATPDARYGVFAWTQRQHLGDLEGDFHRFAFSLFYVDRLTADKANELEIQSVGVQTLEAVLRELRDRGIFAEDGYTFDTFNQRFEDECAGVWCSVTFQVPVSPLCVNEAPEPTEIPDWLTFTAVEAGPVVFLTTRDGTELEVEVSTDRGLTWTKRTASVEGTVLADLQPGEEVKVRGNNAVYHGTEFRMTARTAVSGNIMSLVDAEGFETADTVADLAFALIFSGAPITSAPKLPATNLGTSCYYLMFRNCASLREAPALPATVLAGYCYQGMFFECTALTKAPELPATVLAQGCYASMFFNCASLREAPVLPATALARACYSSMFEGCAALTKAPELPATVVYWDSYSSMFQGCAALTKAPALPAMTLGLSCYQKMFSECTALREAPALPATVLAQHCYRMMFFRSPLVESVTCLAETFALEATDEWLEGVATSGTFTKKAGVEWPAGVSGIPEGWTIQQFNK